MAISGYLACKDYQAANDKINTLCQAVIQNTSRFYTGNSVIDTFLNVKENAISITVKNSSELPNTVNCKHLQTEKKDQIEHGYGIKSMKMIVKKYNGNICFQNMDGIFTVTVLLQNISPST